MAEDRFGDPGVITSAAEQMPFILVVCEGPELRLRWFNAATEALLPGRDDALGRPLADVFTELIGQRWMDAYFQVYRTGEPVTGAEWRAHLTRPDGSIHEIYANFTITAWRDPDGAVRGVIGAGFDVTDIVRGRVTAERQAARLQERYDETRDVVTALQRELLPSGLPVLPGVQLAASYLLAETDRAAGGDWFDAVSRPDGRVALVVGDVVGHGVTASAVMGQLRAVLQERLDAGADLGAALAALDRFARRLPAAHATTICLAVLDPADGTLEYCTAGHPPPLIVTAAGGTRYLPPTGGTPLGTSAVFPIGTDHLDVGDLLLLYTDGILERPDRTMPASSTELAKVAADAAAGRALHAPGTTAAERVCTQTVELLVRATGHNDDVTLLAAQRVSEPPELDLRLPAELTSLRASRQAIAQWLDRIGATADDAFLLQHALGELISNAIEHAFDGELGRDQVGLRATLTPQGRVRAEVTDHGRWREPARQSQRGRGLALTSQLVESLRVTPAETGTVATVTQPLTRPARMLTRVDAGPARPPAEPDGMLLIEQPAEDDSRLTVKGVVDAGTAGRLRHELLRRTRGGRLPLSVDLTGVTHLASAGVAALHAVTDARRDGGTGLALHAAAGSPAALILALVGLPHTTD
jgi:serine phosphatase RsbU (regulator of sigma subunit)/anti-sigma regulatory factor (Ser/Thr protein kinase)/anti-anti-sigma regulatory factor